MINILEYMQLSREQRQYHLKFTEPCIKIGTKNSGECRALLAHFLGTTVPNTRKIHLCHACNEKTCSNPKHLYWGTFSENAYDRQGRKQKSAIRRKELKKRTNARALVRKALKRLDNLKV